MAKAELNVNKIMNKNTWQAKFYLVGIRRFKIKTKIGVILLRLACFIMGCDIIIKEVEND